MERFQYKARDREGKVVSGIVEAASASAGARILREKGLTVVSITAESASLLALLNKVRSRVTHQAVTTFTRQLSTMITAGLPITDALVILRQQSSPALRPVVSQILNDVESGSSLSTALEKHPKVFSPVYVALVQAGEAGGVLDTILARLAETLEKQREFSGKVKGALIYPSIIVVGMLVVALIMMIFVVPRLTSFYKEFNSELPLATRLLVLISGTFSRFWIIVIPLVILFVVAVRIYYKTEKGRRKIDALIFKIPVFGNLTRQIILTEFTRTLGLLVGAGVSILEGLNVVKEVVGNAIMSDGVSLVAKQVEKGFPVAYSLAQVPEAFPLMLSQMVAVGEETGKMEDVLNKISRVFETESEQEVKTLTAAIEPLIMIVLGLGVGFLVFAIILPIYNLTSQF